MGLCSVDVPPSPKSQFHAVGLLLEVSVNWTKPPGLPLVTPVVKSASGAGGGVGVAVGIGDGDGLKFGSYGTVTGSDVLVMPLLSVTVKLMIYWSLVGICGGSTLVMRPYASIEDILFSLSRIFHFQDTIELFSDVDPEPSNNK